MNRYHLIKVIKRAEREQPAQVAAVGGSAHSESSAHDEAGEMEATVESWISEFRQTRQTQQTRFEELKQQFGWLQDGG